MNYLGVYTLFKREFDKVINIWRQTIISPLITNLLFLVIFGVAFEQRVSAFEGIPYLSVLVPGLAAMGLMMNSQQSPTGSIILAKYTNQIHDLLMLPLQGFELALGYIGGGMIRGLMVAAATLAVGAFFTPIHISNIFVIIIFALLLGGIFSSIGVILGITSKDFDQASMLPTFVFTPLIYLGGIFFSVDTLPGVFGTVAKFNPMFYLIDGFRYGFLGVGDSPLWLSLLITSLVFTFVFSLASWMFQSGYKLKT